MRGWDFGFELTEYIHSAPAFTDYSIRKNERDSKNGKKNNNKMYKVCGGYYCSCS